MIDELSKLAVKYRADKWGKHNYTPVYYGLFNDRQKSVKKVLEIGIGGEAASLRMWRDFFPSAKIYGADYMSSRLINNGRIKSILCDQRRKNHILNLIGHIGSDIDLIIDDGSHRPRDQVLTCLTLMPLLKKEAIYIIEEVADANILEQLRLYDCEMMTVGRRFDDRLIIVRNIK